MKEVDLQKVAQVQGEYEIPTIEEENARNRVIGKICFDDRSQFCAGVENFENKVAEIIQKRYPKASMTGSVIDGDKKCMTYVVSSIDKDDVRKVAKLQDLEKDFEDLGGGIYKRSNNELWSLKVNDDGEYNVVRSESELMFGSDLENQEVIVSKRTKDEGIEVLSRNELEERGLFVDEVDGRIVNSQKDNVGSLLFIIEV